jgi:hypothetical protein
VALVNAAQECHESLHDADHTARPDADQTARVGPVDQLWMAASRAPMRNLVQARNSVVETALAAIRAVRPCAASAASSFLYVCIHVHCVPLKPTRPSTDVAGRYGIADVPDLAAQAWVKVRNRLP